MKLSIYAATKRGEPLSSEEALLMTGHMAGICYMKDGFEILEQESPEKTLKRAKSVIKSGHHSVADHVHFTLILENMPKIIAMLLNNEKAYATSEKSARYTTMRCSDLELMLYDKWQNIFFGLIEDAHPEIGPKPAKKLAMENARYFISVFTPSTTMAYTASLRQLNYLADFSHLLLVQCVNCMNDNLFYKKLHAPLSELAELLDQFNVEGLSDNKSRSFSLFAKSNRIRREEWGENYCTSYLGSFAELAQAQRHRTLSYEMIIPDPWKNDFFIPPILEHFPALVREYLADMELVRPDFPQGMRIRINERGTYENFLLKCDERLCGAAQLEICLETKDTLSRYLAMTDRLNLRAVHSDLKRYEGKTKCRLGIFCNRPCPLGPEQAFTRDI